jgi:hypothetical protein
MIVPTFWDVAAIVIARELDAFRPSVVVMNGVAGERQPIWIELGAANRARALRDGSDVIWPAVEQGATYVPLVEEAPEAELLRGNAMSWVEVEQAAGRAIAERADIVADEEPLRAMLEGALLAGFPRLSNTYLCNNVTYTVGWFASGAGRRLSLLRASPPLPGRVNEVVLTAEYDHSRVARVFVHWPSRLAGEHVRAASEVLATLVGAQLAATTPPTVGDNTLAAPSLRGGAFF